MNRSWDSVQYAQTCDLQAKVAKELLSDLAIQPDENVLDFGCGLGNLTMKIADIACKGSVLGVDTSPAMIDQAELNLQRRPLPNVRFQVASADRLRSSGQFDVVFSNSVLHWIKEQRQTLQAIRRCLNVGGRVGFQFPLLDAEHPLIALTQKAIQSLKLEQHYRNWDFPWFVPETPERYADLLRSLCFNGVDVWRRETTYVFDTASTVYGFFSSVGLELFLQPLSGKAASLLKTQLQKLLSALATERGVCLNFSRLYAVATL